MKTITEFSAFLLFDALPKYLEIKKSGKSPEELALALTETFKLEGDKLKFFTHALDIAEVRSQGLKRIVVLQGEGAEKLPESAEKKEEHVYLPEFFPTANKPGKRFDNKRDRGKRGKRDGNDKKKGRRQPRRDAQGDEKTDRRPSRRPSRSPRSSETPDSIPVQVVSEKGDKAKLIARPPRKRRERKPLPLTGPYAPREAGAPPRKIVPPSEVKKNPESVPEPVIAGDK